MRFLTRLLRRTPAPRCHNCAYWNSFDRQTGNCLSPTQRLATHASYTPRVKVPADGRCAGFAPTSVQQPGLQLVTAPPPKISAVA